LFEVLWKLFYPMESWTSLATNPMATVN